MWVIISLTFNDFILKSLPNLTRVIQVVLSTFFMVISVLIFYLISLKIFWILFKKLDSIIIKKFAEQTIVYFIVLYFIVRSIIPIMGIYIR